MTEKYRWLVQDEKLKQVCESHGYVYDSGKHDLLWDLARMVAEEILGDIEYWFTNLDMDVHGNRKPMKAMLPSKWKALKSKYLKEQ